MYKRKKHREALHRHRPRTEVSAEAAQPLAPDGVAGRLRARIEALPAVQHAEEVVRHALETPAARIGRTALGYAFRGDLRRAFVAVRRGLRTPPGSAHEPLPAE